MDIRRAYKDTNPANIAHIAILFSSFLVPTVAHAEEFTAGVVMTKMGTSDRYSFVAGIVEGLAHARYIRDGKTPKGRSCLYGWFYDDKATLQKIYEGFRRYPNALPGQVVGTLAAVKCGA